MAPRLAETLPRLTAARASRALRLMLGRSDWSPALVDALERDPAQISELALDQKQALSTHPDPKIAARAKRLLAKGGGLPDPDRQKVLDRLAPLLKEGGDSAPGQGRLPAAVLPSATGTARPAARSAPTCPAWRPFRAASS